MLLTFFHSHVCLILKLFQKILLHPYNSYQIGPIFQVIFFHKQIFWKIFEGQRNDNQILNNQTFKYFDCFYFNTEVHLISSTDTDNSFHDELMLERVILSSTFSQSTLLSCV